MTISGIYRPPQLAAALCSLLLLPATLWPSPAADPQPDAAAKPLNAILIVARPELTDPLFGDSVVLDLGGLSVRVLRLEKIIEAEIARGSWTLEHAASDTIFNGQAERPWPTPQAPNRTT